MELLEFNKNTTVQQLLDCINSHLSNINKTDVIDADGVETHIRNLFMSSNLNFNWSTVSLLKGKRTIKIFNMIFDLKLSKNKLGMKHYDWGHKSFLYMTVVNIKSAADCDLNITLEKAYADFKAVEELKALERADQYEKDKQKLEKALKALKELNVDTSKLSSKQFSNLANAILGK